MTAIHTRADHNRRTEPETFEQFWDVLMFEKETGNHIGTRHHKTESEVQALKLQHKELDLKKRPAKAPPKPEPPPEEPLEDIQDA